MSAVRTRMEHDQPGDRKVPAAICYSIQTPHALENPDITVISVRGAGEIVLKHKLMSLEQRAEAQRSEVLIKPPMILNQIA
ncbi:hypothetical protein ACO0LB_05335 [Undibacterium sp. SXout7W]|uniref:hypothetical protein n=1 Tax=Undibacterium sp. SXout7W TaxID=3413049 RepID=UPI003BF048F2